MWPYFSLQLEVYGIAGGFLFSYTGETEIKAGRYSGQINRQLTRQHHHDRSAHRPYHRAEKSAIRINDPAVSRVRHIWSDGVKRQDIRRLKREIADGNNTGAMLALLERSVHFGHKKLALYRCLQAELMGLAIAPEILRYCQQVADRLPNDVLHKIFRTASAIRHIT